MLRDLGEIGPSQFLVGLTLAAIVSTLVFAHAERHGNQRAMAWGASAFLFAGLVVPLYFLRYWLRGRRI